MIANIYPSDAMLRLCLSGRGWRYSFYSMRLLTIERFLCLLGFVLVLYLRHIRVYPIG